MKKDEAFQGLLEAAPDAMIVVNSQGRITHLNAQTEDVFGYRRDELIGQEIEILIPESLRKTHAALRVEYNPQPHSRPFGTGIELSGRRQDGSILRAEVSLKPFDTEDGLMVLCAIRETDAHRRVEEQVRKLSRAVEQSASLIVITDTEGKIEYINPKVSEVTGYTADEVLGQNPRLFKSGHTSAEEYANLWAAISSGQEWRGEFHNRKKNGEIYWSLASISPITDPEGRITHYLSIQEDITERKRMEEALRDQAADLAASNQELNAFSYTVAHDLKSPLGGVLGYVEMVADMEAEQLSEPGRAMLSEAVRSGYRMKQIIESLLLLAQLRDAVSTLEPVAMQPVMGAALDRCKLDVTARGVAVSLPKDPPPVIGYAPWLEEVFVNLFSNAIKYMGLENAKPRITVRARRLGDLVRYEVRDNGVGIARKNQERLFETFSRFHTSYAEGFGIGLSIVKRIIQKLNGELGVKSTAGKGSTFWFSLPAAPQEDQAAAPPTR